MPPADPVLVARTLLLAWSERVHDARGERVVLGGDDLRALEARVAIALAAARRDGYRAGLDAAAQAADAEAGAAEADDRADPDYPDTLDWRYGAGARRAVRRIRALRDGGDDGT